MLSHLFPRTLDCNHAKHLLTTEEAPPFASPAGDERGCVQVGVQKARQIAAQHGAKYIPVHHMEAHALIARAGTAVQFPYLCLLVSGGHNMIVVVEGVGSYTLLGSTLDDAVGAPVNLPMMTGRDAL